MRYFISTKESKRNESGMIPVSVVFRHEGREFAASTGIAVKYAMNGMVFSAEEPNLKAKTRRLMCIMDEVDRYVLEHVDSDYERMKEDLRCIVTGKDPREKRSLASFVREFAELKSGSTRKIYLRTAALIEGYAPEATFGSVNGSWLDGFVRSIGENASVNYAAINLRNIRAVFNWAIDNEWTSCYPFRRYKIKSEKVAINNISLEQLRAVRDFPLDDWRRIYRDLFMLSFYLCGINPADLLRLKASDMKNGRIRYKRAKTGHLFDIPVPKPAEEIISRWRGRKWLLCPLDNYSDYRGFYCHWNAALKKIGRKEVVPDKVGRLRKVVWHPIVEGMTVYTARYTFASIGAELEIPRETIALCLGHSWADVTSHYIAYDTKRIDDAVARIVAYVEGS